MILIRNDFEHHFKSNVIKILESLQTVRWPNASVSCRKSKSVSDKLKVVRDPAVHMPRAAGEVQQIAGHVAHVRLHRHRLLAVRAGLWTIADDSCTARDRANCTGLVLG